MAIRKEAPYYDDYSPEKNYTRILAVPGQNLQARELTQLGTMQRDFTERLGKAVFSQGEVIDGCDIAIKENKVIILAGSIFYNGLVRLVPQTELSITGNGTETLGVKIISSLITATNDHTLRDPAVGYENEGQSGCHREKEDLLWFVNDETATTIFQLEDGVLTINSDANDAEAALNAKLAQRTYDQSGNYKVEGLKLSDRKESDDNTVSVNLSEGKAYIKGYCVENPANAIIKLNKSKTTQEVLSEPKKYTAGVQNYQLNNSPLATVKTVLAPVQVTENVTRSGIINGTDTLVNRGLNSVISVERVWDAEHDYVEGQDYSLNNDNLSWNFARITDHKEPRTGNTYYVTYTYNRNMTNGTNYEVTTNENGENELMFIGDLLPVDDSRFFVNYDFYQHRKDTIVLDKNGNIDVLEGIPNTADNVTARENSSSDCITIGTVHVLPNSNEVEIENDNSKRLTQQELYNVSRRVSDIEYNLAMSDLDNEARSTESATDLKGVYTDNFLDTSKMDISHADNYCTINTEEQELSLPEIGTNDTSHFRSLAVNENSVQTNMSVLGNVISAPYIENVILEQNYATETFKVNEYAVFEALTAVRIAPAVDNWIDTSYTTIGNSAVEYLPTSYRSGGSRSGGGSESITQNAGTYVRSASSANDSAIQYMRQRDITVSGNNFHTDVEVSCSFDDKPVAMKIADTDVNGTALSAKDKSTLGSTSGNLLPNSKGVVNGIITVPEHVPCGSVNIKLRQEVVDGEDVIINEGKAVYDAHGTSRLITTVNTTVQRWQKVITTYSTSSSSDPIAELFTFDRDTVLTALDVYFSKKGASELFVQVRGIENGYPSQTVYAETTVSPEDVQVSTDASVPTHIVFNQPVYCEENKFYCFVILSDSNLYEVFTATLGKVTIDADQATVWKNPYSDGVLFTSSNSQTWTAHQASDLKFKLYEAEYTGDGCIIFNSVPLAYIDRLLLIANSEDYKNSGVEWYYKLNDVANWKPITAFSITELTDLENYNSNEDVTVTIKCILHVKDSKSPFIARDNINIAGLIFDTTGRYVSRQITMSEEFTNIKVYFEGVIPPGSSITVEALLDDNPEWQVVPISVLNKVDQEFSKYYGALEGVKSTSYRIKITMTTNSVFNRPRVRKLMSVLRY